VIQTGSLVVVGTGLRISDHLTPAAAATIRAAESVLYLVPDPHSEQIIRGMNPANAESLAGAYHSSQGLLDVYEAIVNRVMSRVRAGRKTCLAMYGHPGILVVPTRRAVQQAREAGFPTAILPGISAEDCLFADLGIDPAMSGWQSYWAADFLICGRRIDPTSAVVLWGVGGIGTWTATSAPDHASLDVLLERLARDYAPDHEVVLYEAAVEPGRTPRISRATLSALPRSGVTLATTLYIPPARPAIIDETLCARIGVTRATFELFRGEW
jgi:uncharacterized protein YabN with tetrapyrrole methylase and pyrophosphatase domain